MSRLKYNFHKKISLLTCLGLSIWISGIIITPLLAASEGILWQKIASFMYFIYQPVCHQMVDRSFSLEGFTMAVCIRCFCFYLGGFFITSRYLLRDEIQMWKISTYALFVTPTILDFIFEKFSLYSNIVGLRILTGLMLGIAIFHLLLISLTASAPRIAKIPAE
jgi:uncharacterized membrane protein